MPSENRRYEVCGTENIHSTGESSACDAVETGHVPGYLWAVDGEVGGCWAVLSLGDEDLVGVLGGHLFGCYWSSIAYVSRSWGKGGLGEGRVGTVMGCIGKDVPGLD
jgi:hypothetical protein